jgi:crossover junction endodeoxyribonuclease RuvC
MRILGIDPGYERLGIAILEKGVGASKEQVLYSECFHTSTEAEFGERLVLIGQRVEKIIKEFAPKGLAIETLFLDNNQKTAMRVSEARGVILYIAAKTGLKIMEISPLAVKMAVTGYGKSGKAEVMKMVKMLVNMDKNKTSDDELDAIAIALSALASYPHF